MANALSQFKECTYHDFIANKNVPVRIRFRISYIDSAIIAKNVRDAVVGEDGSYTPYHRDWALWNNLLLFYTNLPMKNITPGALDSLLVNTDIQEIVHEFTDMGQIEEIERWADDMIAHEKQKSGLERMMSQLNAALSPYLPALVEAVKGQLPDVSDAPSEGEEQE